MAEPVSVCSARRVASSSRVRPMARQIEPSTPKPTKRARPLMGSTVSCLAYATISSHSSLICAVMLLSVLSPFLVNGARRVSGTRSSGGSGAFLLPGEPVRKQGGCVLCHLGQPFEQGIRAGRLEQTLVVDGAQGGDGGQLARPPDGLVVEGDRGRHRRFAELRLVGQRPAHGLFGAGERVGVPL